jgi:hypothetical protein
VVIPTIIQEKLLQLSGILSLPKVYRVYKVSKVSKVYRVYRVYKAFKVYKVFKASVLYGKDCTILPHYTNRMMLYIMMVTAL